MKKNNVTIKDVAREAGVSVATVSYVINNNKEQSISEQTKQKIWQVVNMLNYKPSVYAKNLRMAPNSKLIAVCSDTTSSLYKAEYMLILESLYNVFSKSYGLLFQSKPFEEITTVDAIIAYNSSREDFYTIGNKNYVPLIALDSNINDPLFFQITTNYEELRLRAIEYFNSSFSFIDLLPANKELEQEIRKVFPDALLVSDLVSLERTSIELSNTNCILTTSYTLYKFFSAKGKNVYYDTNLLKNKCEQLFTCVKQALSHEPFEIHNYKI